METKTTEELAARGTLGASLTFAAMHLIGKSLPPPALGQCAAEFEVLRVRCRRLHAHALVLDPVEQLNRQKTARQRELGIVPAGQAALAGVACALPVAQRLAHEARAGVASVVRAGKAIRSMGYQERRPVLHRGDVAPRELWHRRSGLDLSAIHCQGTARVACDIDASADEFTETAR